MYTPEKTLKKLSERQTRLHEWLQVNRDSFCEAIGMWADDDMIVLFLDKMMTYSGGHFPMYKDDIDSARCDALTPFLRKRDVDMNELRLAVGLLVQGFNASCDRIRRLEAQIGRMKQIPPRPFGPLTGGWRG